MFDQFREKKPTEKLCLIIGAVVLIAAFLTVITQLPKLLTPKIYVGEIFGKKITQEQFDNVYRHNLTITKFQYGQMFEKIEPLLDLEDDTWDQLTLMQEAKNRKIKVTDKEVVDAIAKYKVFFRNKKFDELLYKQIIRISLKSTIKDFEEAIRESIIKEKLRNEATASITFSVDQLKDEFKRHHTKAKITHTLIASDDFKDQVTLNDQKIQSYYQKHKHDFFVPPTIKVDYIRADYPPEAGVQKRVETKFKARAIRKEHEDGENFETLTEKFKYTLHESDYFNQQQLTFPFGQNKEGDMLKMDQTHKLLKDIFTMEPGQVLEPIEWEKGYLVIKLKEKRASYLKNFEEAKEKIKEKLIKEKTKGLAKEKTQEYLNQIKASSDSPLETEGFTKVTTSLNLETSTTELLPLKHLLFTLNLRKESWENLFMLTAKKPLSAPSATSTGYILMHLDNLEPADMNLFDEKKLEFAEQITKERKDEAYNTFLSDMQKRAGLKKFPVK
ncbi:hypothetical protein MNBD_UNCLBAC01-1272 [hydrothermal vent metagenome]|uniref:Periplasmic chaperone PpiD n=1 Tax=hydrothermal vent metagenome TaxID=652676 RepID=A0A3B1D3N3_9ZZZZ